jgi:hypothetical protein
MKNIQGLYPSSAAIVPRELHGICQNLEKYVSMNESTTWVPLVTMLAFYAAILCSEKATIS